MPVRHGRPATFAARRATPKPRHLCIEATFVDEDQAARVEIELSVEPLFSRRQNVRALLFGRVRGLLWNGPPSFEASARMPVFWERRRTSHDDHDTGN